MFSGVSFYQNLMPTFFLRRRFIWNFIRVENEHISRSDGSVCHSQEELREYDEEDEENDE